MMFIVVLLSIFKTLFEGRLGWIAFPFTIPRTILGRLSGGAKKILVVQKVLYITNGHIFWFCPKKVLRAEDPLLHARSKRSFHYSTDRMNRSVTILSHGRFPLYLLPDIFPQKLGTPFQKTFLAPDSPST